MQRLSRLKQKSGFTLVELIIVIVLIGILAITAGPALFGRSGVDAVLYQDRLVGLLRLQQQRAMQDTTNDYCVLIQGNRFGIPQMCGDATLPANFNPEFEGLKLSEASTNVVVSAQPSVSTTYFNGLGCIGTSAKPACGSLTLQIDITEGTTVRSVCVQSQGYIREGAC